MSGIMTSFLLLPPADPPQVAPTKTPRASSETRLAKTTSGSTQRQKKRSSSTSSSSAIAPGEDDGLVSQLKKLKVSSMTEAQKRKQKQLKHREFRNKLKQVILQRKGSLRSQNIDKSLNKIVIKSSRLSQVVSSLSVEDHRQFRHRHSSESSPVQIDSGQLFTSISTKSLQDFSKCCKKLETFSIGDLNSDNANFKDIQFQHFQACSVDDDDEEEGFINGFEQPHECDNLDHKCIKKRSSSSSCAQQARNEYNNDISVNDLAGYLEDSIVFPKKMSYMAEMMYT